MLACMTRAFSPAVYDRLFLAENEGGESRGQEGTTLVLVRLEGDDQKEGVDVSQCKLRALTAAHLHEHLVGLSRRRLPAALPSCTKLDLLLSCPCRVHLKMEPSAAPTNLSLHLCEPDRHKDRPFAACRKKERSTSDIVLGTRRDARVSC